MKALSTLLILFGLFIGTLESSGAIQSSSMSGLMVHHNTKNKEVFFELNRKVFVKLKSERKYIGRLTDIQTDSMTLTSLQDLEKTVTLAYGDLQIIQEYNGPSTRLFGPLLILGGAGATGLSALLAVGLAGIAPEGAALSALVCAAAVGVTYGGYRIWGRRCNLDKWHIQF